jgi:hypothetical protein
LGLLVNSCLTPPNSINPLIRLSWLSIRFPLQDRSRILKLVHPFLCGVLFRWWFAQFMLEMLLSLNDWITFIYKSHSFCCLLRTSYIQKLGFCWNRIKVPINIDNRLKLINLIMILISNLCHYLKNNNILQFSLCYRHPIVIDYLQNWAWRRQENGMFSPCIWCFSYIQHGSYPVMSPDNSSFPPSVYTGRTSLHYITTKSAYQPHDATIFPVYNPLPGNWFVAAYISHWDQHVRQEVWFHF